MSDVTGLIANYVNCLQQIESAIRTRSRVFEIDQFGTLALSGDGTSKEFEVCPGEYLLLIGMYYRGSHFQFDAVFVDEDGELRCDEPVEGKVFTLNSADVIDLLPGFNAWFAAKFNLASETDSIGDIADLEVTLIDVSLNKPMIREKFEEVVNKHELVEAEQARQKIEAEHDYYTSDTEGLGLF